jgi:opacity protein-like surface antigen
LGAGANTVRRGMQCRLLTILVLASGLGLAPAASAQTAPGPAAPGSAPPPASATPPSLAGFEALASVGYGTVTELEQLELQPYGPAFGLDVGYTWEIGVRVGVELSYGLGRETSQTYERRRREAELTSDGESFTGVVSIGYDLWLRFLILRYSLGLGATWVSWKLTNVQGSFAGYAAPEGSKASFVFAPGLTLLWPYEHFECGLGFDYFFQAEAQAPSGIVGQLLVGMKL